MRISCLRHRRKRACRARQPGSIASRCSSARVFLGVALGRRLWSQPAIGKARRRPLCVEEQVVPRQCAAPAPRIPTRSLPRARSEAGGERGDKMRGVSANVAYCTQFRAVGCAFCARDRLMAVDWDRRPPLIWLPPMGVEFRASSVDTLRNSVEFQAQRARLAALRLHLYGAGFSSAMSNLSTSCSRVANLRA
jgi:hypothetical protein